MRRCLIALAGFVLLTQSLVTDLNGQDEKKRGQRGARGGRQARVDNAPKIGDEAPTFVLSSVDGKTETDLESFKGDKPVVLMFGSYT